MINLRTGVAGVWLFLSWSSVLAAAFPLSVAPNPVQFGVVPLNSSTAAPIYVTNNTGNSVNVSNMTISGANSADFAFSGPPCLGIIPGFQTCYMNLAFTPSAMGNRAATLVISITGTTTQLKVPLQGSGGNPIPSISSLSPASVYVGGPGFTLAVSGSGFIASSVVEWNNSPLTTQYVSSTQITALVPASDITNTGSTWVYVSNPAPGGGNSGPANVQILALDPSINSVAPISAVAGTGATTVSINGYNFMTGATVLWNGKSRPTTYISSAQLQVQLSSTDVSKAQIGQLAVSNPAPGGLSQPATFNVTYPAKITILDLPANDLVWDPYVQRIYASLPSSYGSAGNTIAVINPSNGQITAYYFAGSEPTMLGLSADAKYLYAGLNGAGSIQRLLLPNFTPDIDVSLGTSQYGGLNNALDLQVSPGDPHTIAVAVGSGCCSGGQAEFFTDTTQLPNSITNPAISYLAFADPSTLFGYVSNTLSEIAVNASGGTLTQQWYGLVTGGGRIHYDAGLVYGSGGQVFDPQTGLLVGTYDVGNFCCTNIQLLPDSPVNRVFVLGNTPFFNGLGITSYDLSHFTPMAVTDLSQFPNSSAASPIRWGSNGLAFILQTGCCPNSSAQVVLVQSTAMVLPPSTTRNPVPSAQSLSPASATHGSWNFQMTIQGTGFVPGSQVTWNGHVRSVDYVSPTQLTVYIPWSDITAAGSAAVVVKNPAPGGGSSNALTFTIH